MDNDEDAVEKKALQKEAKYTPAKHLLEEALRAARGSNWTVIHLSMVVGWKLSLNEERWKRNLTELGIPEPKHKKIIQAS
eukprot:2714556-Rhodomonas_salina.1